MATKKPGASKKKTTKRKKRSVKKKTGPAVATEFKKMIVGLAILLAICLTLAMIADIVFKPGQVKKKKPVAVKKEKPMELTPIQEEIPLVAAKKKTNGLKEKTKDTITYEVYHGVDPTIIEKPVRPSKDRIPEIAIIIDDIGYDRKIALALCDLDDNITFSILPYSPYGRRLAEKLHERGAQLMLHLPMEPVQYPQIDPGPGAILSSMPPDVLLDQLTKNIDEIPYIIGVNNHMGSRLTAESDQMNQIFSILKRRQLFFIDSRTAPKSQGKSSARLLKVNFAQRDVFLDNFQQYTYIRGQLSELVELAMKHGSAIGIGHPYKATLETLEKELPKLKDKVKIVRAGQLTHIPG